jgi:hypothetical protein
VTNPTPGMSTTDVWSIPPSSVGTDTTMKQNKSINIQNSLDEIISNLYFLLYTGNEGGGGPAAGGAVIKKG